jgi:hypothetical protein
MHALLVRRRPRLVDPNWSAPCRRRTDQHQLSTPWLGSPCLTTLPISSSWAQKRMTRHRHPQVLQPARYDFREHSWLTLLGQNICCFYHVQFLWSNKDNMEALFCSLPCKIWGFVFNLCSNSLWGHHCCRCNDTFALFSRGFLFDANSRYIDYHWLICINLRLYQR